MDEYLFRKWKDARKGGMTLFSMLSPVMKAYTVFTLFSAALSSMLLLAAELSWLPLSGFATNVYAFFYFSLVLLVILALAAAPVDRDTERTRIDAYYKSIAEMLDREGIDDSDVCDAICVSLDAKSQHAMQRLESKWGFLSSLLLFFAAAIGGYLTDYSVSKTGEEFDLSVWLTAACALAVCLIALLSCYIFLSTRANTPRLKTTCAADLRIAFHMAMANSQDSRAASPRHMRSAHGKA